MLNVSNPNGNVFESWINEALSFINHPDAQALHVHVVEEVRGAAAENVQAPDTLLLKLGRAAKAVRLSGELPSYLAKLTALVFAAQDNGSPRAEQVRERCGLFQEAEFVWLVVDAWGKLPDLELDPHGKQKIELMKKAYRQGYYYEQVNRGCAQCAMAAISDVTKKEDAAMFRAANGFAAGMGLLGDGVCGGYSGGTLSIGLFAGRRREFFDGDKAQKDLNGKLVRALHDRFIEAYGSVTCHDIHNVIFGRAFHITRPEDKAAFEEAGAHTKDKCPTVVGIGAAWTVEALFNEGLLAEFDTED
ncbi:C-GCAxxG-C-C family protein [Eubacteriales bacterium OttesenSCG-928-K08]|nr:C-GCAxxG-C-C family protein [Eubacteriales bacterium OttesenSCG-928-K08]